MVPVRYNLRSMLRRRARTGLTILGIAAVISVYIVMASVGRQMRTLFGRTGHADEVQIQQAGALGPEFSSVSRASITWVRALPRLAQRPDGQPLTSPELYLSSFIRSGDRRGDVAVRGVTADALSVYREVHVVQGAPMAPGHKLMVGQRLARSRGLSVGDRVELEGEQWSVAGIFAAEGTVWEQELWADLDDLGAATNRADLTGIYVRAKSAADAKATVDEINGQRAEPLQAMTGEAAFARVGGMSLWMSALGRFIAIIIAIGAIFGGMNTMYAAVATRAREIGILRALGYRGGAVLVSFVTESVLVAILGGVAGALLALGVAKIPMNMPFLLDGAVILRPPDFIAGLVLAAIVGLVGGLLPALQAARLKVVDALR